jgi:hypothetical protein
MSLETFIYLASTFESLGTSIVLIAIFVLIFWVIKLVVCKINEAESYGEKITKIDYKIPTFCLCVILFASFIPDKKTMYLMAGVSAGKDVLQSKAAIKTYELLNKYLDDELNKQDK